MRKKALSLFLTCAWMLSFNSASAHHSTVEFDYSKAFAVHGSIKEFQWTNPHAWVQVLVPNDAGELVEYGFELEPICVLYEGEGLELSAIRCEAP